MTWTRFRAAINPFLRRAFGLYSAYPLSPAEYVGTADLSTDDARHYLRQNAYEPQYLSAAKRHPATNQLHDLSYRRVPGTHPPQWTADDWSPAECQYHVHVFAVDDRAEFFSHYETRPDIFAPRVDIERLRTHYRPTNKTYRRGVTDLDV